MKELFDFLGATNNVETFFYFFVPGFISMLIAGLIGPSQDSDFSKRIAAVVGYSALNYAALRLAILIIEALDLAALTPFVKVLFVFILPFVYPFVIYRLREKQFWGFSTPYPGAWDQFFARRNRKYFVRAKLKGDGGFVHGFYGKESLASQAPASDTLLLERVYDVSPEGKWIRRSETAAFLLPMSECESLEFIIPEEKT